MCGYFGSISVERLEDDIRASIPGLIRHRGPDSSRDFETIHRGIHVYLSFARLAIIDLSHAGDQPMTSQSGRHTMVFNGEIYNHKELRSLLPRDTQSRLIGSSDSEVLLELWECFGVDVLEKLEGMFSFAVIDWADQEISLVKDAYGIKPLFFINRRGAIHFASEVSALAQLSSKELNTSEVFDFLSIDRYDRGTRTFFKDISSVLPGGIAKFSIAGGSIDQKFHKKWDPPIETVTDVDYSSAVVQTRELFLESLELHSRSDVPVAYALSGGLDSSSIVCGIRHLFPNREIVTFSYLSQNPWQDESPFIQLVEESVNAHSNRVKLIDADPHDFQNHIFRQSMPVNNTHFFSQYLVFKAAAKSGFKVVIEGQGADEVLGGYEGYPSAKIESLLSDRDLGELFRYLAALPGARQRIAAVGSAMGRLLGDLEFMRRGLSFSARKELMRLFGQEKVKNGYGRYPRRWGLNEELWFSSTIDLLPRLLRHGDHNAMANGVENRVPFLGRKFSRHCLALPHQYLVSSEGTTKKVFRDAVSEFTPMPVVQRRDKIGFGAEFSGIPGFRNQSLALNLHLPELLLRLALLREWLECPNQTFGANYREI